MNAGQIQIPVFSAEKSRFHRDKALQSAGKVGKLEFASLTCSTLNLQKGSLEVPTDTDMSGIAAVTTNDVVAGFGVKIGTGTEPCCPYDHHRHHRRYRYRRQDLYRWQQRFQCKQQYLRVQCSRRSY